MLEWTWCHASTEGGWDVLDLPPSKTCMPINLLGPDNGDIPDDPGHVYRTMGILHTCDNKCGGESGSSFLGMHADNMHDAINKYGHRNGRIPVGEQHPNAKVNA